MTIDRLTYEGNFCDISMCLESPGSDYCLNEPCSQRKVWERLKEYEDLEEQGKLIRLPCKVGDILFYVFESGGKWAIDENPITEVGTKGVFVSAFFESADDMSVFIAYDELGDTVFLTHEEAEVKLKEMQNEAD